MKLFCLYPLHNSDESETLLLVSAPQLSSPTSGRTRSQIWCNQVLSGAGGSVGNTAALHGGAVNISIGWVEVALVDILDPSHSVAISVFPAQAMKRFNEFHYFTSYFT